MTGRSLDERSTECKIRQREKQRGAKVEMGTNQMQQMMAAFSVFSHVPRPMAAEAVSSPANAVSWVRWIGHERWVVVLT